MRTANRAGSLENAPKGPFAGSPQSFATFTPGAPAGSRSVHFRSAAEIGIGRLPDVPSLSLAVCAHDARRNNNAKPSTYFLIQPPFDLVSTRSIPLRTSAS